MNSENNSFTQNTGPGQLEWHFSQVFGERIAGEDVQDADLISAVEFDHTGDYLATGDHNGRVVLFERTTSNPSKLETDLDHRALTPHQINPCEYRYLTEFQSHEREFDYLKSVEIEEKINKIRWLRQWQGSNSLTLLTTNDKTIKLWKVYEKQLACVAELNLNGSNHNRALSNVISSPGKLSSVAIEGRPRAESILKIPKITSTERILAHKCRKTYSSAHTYHINSIALSADHETFISADDLRINLWHLDRTDTSFNIVDIKPPSMEDLTEVITCAEFHPKEGHIFAYASSKGCIRLNDMRQSALCDTHAKMFQVVEPEGPRNFFSEIITSINDIKFLGCDGNTILSRDYMMLRVWDARYEACPVNSYPVHETLRSTVNSYPVHETACPVNSYPVHETLRSRLSDLYESDAIFDKFDVCASSNGKYFATGSYSNFFRVVSEQNTGPTPGALLEASKDPMRQRLIGSGSRLPSRFIGFGRAPIRDRFNGGSGYGAMWAENALCSDMNNKIQHLSWHPECNMIATAVQNSLYTFYGRDNRHSSMND